ncbi:MAG: DUF6160 family protein [Acidobacteriota bacterium]
MQKLKSALAMAVLSTAGLSAHAFSAISDSELSTVTGQDGVTIGGDLNIKIGAFTWTDTDTDGGSVSFNNISIKGMFVQTIDVLNADTIIQATIFAMRKYVGSRAISEANKLIDGGVYDGVSDVVQFAFPDAGLDTRLTPTIKIGSITNGNAPILASTGKAASYGSLEIKNLDMQGTKIWLWAH